MCGDDDFGFWIEPLDFLKQVKATACWQFGFCDDQVGGILLEQFKGDFCSFRFKNAVLSFQQHGFEQLTTLGDVIDNQDGLNVYRHDH